ncbi:MAG: hypothetical protein RJQ00_10295 [Vicingaceae bacterium]
MTTAYFSTFLLFILGIYLAFKNNLVKSNEVPLSFSIAAFLLKIIAAYSVWFIYSYYYSDRASADIFKYFDDAASIFDASRERIGLRWQLLFGTGIRGAAMDSVLANTMHWDTSSSLFFNDNRTMIRLHLLLYHFSNGFYHLHLLFFTLISCLGSYVMYRFFTNFSSLNRKLLFIIAFAIPSVLFWCSAPLKECWLLLGLGTFLFYISKLLQKNSLVAWTGLVFSILILLSIKVYFLFALIPACIFLFITHFLKQKSIHLSFLIIHLVFGIGFLLFNEKIIAILSQKLLDFKSLANEVGASSIVSISNYSDLSSFFYALPKALYNVFFRAAIPIDFSPFSIMAAAETVGLLILLILPFFFFRKPNYKEKQLAWFCASFVLITAAIIGLTCPVLGAIVRYKAPLIPFYLILLLTFVDLRQLKRLISK